MASGTIPVIKGVNNFQILTSDDDLNNYYGSGKEGFYYINAAADTSKNRPYGWCCLIVFTVPAGMTMQMLWGWQMYIRVYSGSPLQWSSWYKVETTQV